MKTTEAARGRGAWGREGGRGRGAPSPRTSCGPDEGGSDDAPAPERIPPQEAERRRDDEREHTVAQHADGLEEGSARGSGWGGA